MSDSEKLTHSPEATAHLISPFTCNVYERKPSVELRDNFLSKGLQHIHKLSNPCNVCYSKKLHFKTITLSEIHSAESHVIVCYRLSLIKQLLITNWCLNGGLNSVLYISDSWSIEVRDSKLSSACFVIVFAAVVHVKVHHGFTFCEMISRLSNDKGAGSEAWNQVEIWPSEAKYCFLGSVCEALNVWLRLGPH